MKNILSTILLLGSLSCKPPRSSSNSNFATDAIVSITSMDSFVCLEFPKALEEPFIGSPPNKNASSVIALRLDQAVSSSTCKRAGAIATCTVETGGPKIPKGTFTVVYYSQPDLPAKYLNALYQEICTLNEANKDKGITAATFTNISQDGSSSLQNPPLPFHLDSFLSGNSCIEVRSIPAGEKTALFNHGLLTYIGDNVSPGPCPTSNIVNTCSWFNPFEGTIFRYQQKNTSLAPIDQAAKYKYTCADEEFLSSFFATRSP